MKQPASRALGGFCARKAGHDASLMGGSGGEDASGVVPKAGDGSLDETASGFGGHAELFADFAIAALLPVDETEAALDRVAGPGVEGAEQLVEPGAFGFRDDGLLGADRVARHQIAERAVTVVADRAIERHRRGETMEPGVLVVELVAVTRHLSEGCAQARRTVTRQADKARLLVERPTDGLADPEGRVGGELESPAPVELVDGVLEAEVALLHEVEEIHAGGEGIAAGDADDEAKVRPDEPVLGGVRHPHDLVELWVVVTGGDPLGGGASGFDGAGKLPLLFCVEEGDLTDLVQIQTNCVTHGGFLNPNYPVVIPFPPGRVRVT